MTTHAEIARRWVRGGGKGLHWEGSLIYSRDTIYSWSTGFPIARMTQRKRGWKSTPVVLVRRHGGYSQSTSEHVSAVHWALRKARRRYYWCDNVLAKTVIDHNANLVRALDAVEALIGRAARARTRGAEYLDEARAELRNLRGYARCFGLPIPLGVKRLQKTIRDMKIQEAKK